MKPTVSWCDTGLLQKSHNSMSHLVLSVSSYSQDWRGCGACRARRHFERHFERVSAGWLQLRLTCVQTCIFLLSSTACLFCQYSPC